MDERTADHESDDGLNYFAALRSYAERALAEISQPVPHLGTVRDCLLGTLALLDEMEKEGE